MGNTTDAFSTATDSYGIEICSDADTRGGGTIDFTYPFITGGTNIQYYAGRMFFENNSAYFGWNANFIPASSELMATPQMTLDKDGLLSVQNNISVPAISLNGVNMTTGFKTMNLTATTVLVSGSGTVSTNLNTIGTLYVSSATTLRSSLNVNLGITGTSLSILGNITASGQTHIMNATAQNADVSLTLRNYASGTSSLFLNTNNTLPSRIQADALGNIVITSYTNTSTIKFYSGSTIDYTISSTGGANGSDARWKTDVANITNALDKINNLQGKTFILNNNPNRQLGFIAQEVISVVPEAVYIDTSDENNYHFSIMIDL